MIFAKWIEDDGRFSFSETDNGGVEISEEAHRLLLEGIPAGKLIVADANGYPSLIDRPALTVEQITSQYTLAAQAYLDNVAWSWGYGDAPGKGCADRLVGYVGDPEPQFDADAVAFRAWRSAYWKEAAAIKVSVSKDGATKPASVADFLALLPAPPAKPAV